MNFRFIIPVVLLQFLLANPLASVAQLPSDKRLTQFVLKNYTTEQGLHANTILKLNQTKEGFIWIGTYEGLQRFDGKEFKLYNTKNLPGLQSASISDIITTKSNDLLFGTRGKGAYLLKNDKVRLLHPQLSNVFVTSLLEASNNDLWIGTNFQGIYILNSSGIKFQPIDHYFDLRITKIIEINPGEFWAATETRGILIIKSGAVTLTLNKENGLDDNYVSDLLQYKDKVFACTQRGLNVVDLHSKAIKDLPELKGITVNKVAIDSLQNLWIGTSRGVFRKQPNLQMEVLDKRHGLINDDIWDILFDKEGNAWLATYRAGLFELSDGKFTNYDAGDGMSSADVQSIFEWKHDTYLVGSQKGDIDVFSNNTISKFPLKNQVHAGIYDIKEDHEGNLWIATYNGLIKKDIHGNEKYFNTDSGLTSNLLMCLLIDSENQLWIGTRNKGVMVMKEDKIVNTYSTEHLLESNLIMCIQQNAKGDVWVGTNSAGLYIFEKGRQSVKHYSTDDGLKTNLIFNVSFDKKDPDKTWIVTNQGIASLHKGKIVMLTDNSGMPESSLFDILEDDYGYFWIPNSQGVMYVNKQELINNMQDSTQTVHWKLFGAQDGMKTVQCLGATKSLISAKKEIWIPMANGLIKIHPGKIKKNEIVPPIYVGSVEVDGTSLDSAFNNIEIEPGLKRLSIRYGGISYYFNEGMRYKVKLEPYDEKWLDMQNKREVVYTNLPGGKYTFKVQASNSDGVWNETGASFQFIIKPHFYETYLFYTSIALLILLAITFIIRTRTRQIANRNKLLRELVDLKTTELQKNLDDLKRAQVQLVQSEKMASLGVLTAGIAHEINNPVNFISVGIAALDRKLIQLKKSLTGLIMDETLEKDISQTQSKIDQLLKDIKIGTSRTEEIVSSLRTFSHLDKAELKESDINEGIESTLVLLNSKFKDRIKISKHLEENLPQIVCNPGQLNQVFMNILSNAIDAIKETGTITIRTSSSADHIEIRITDTGCGIPKEAQEKIFEPFFTTKGIGQGTGLGLSISYGIIKQHKGNIKVTSEVGIGTEFVIWVPCHLRFKDITESQVHPNGNGQ